MYERRSTFLGTTALVVVTSLFSYYAGAAGLFPKLNQYVPTRPKTQAESPGTPSNPGADLKQLQRVQQFIQDQFFDPVTVDKLTQGALRGMVEATGDKYAAYFSPDEYKRFLEHFKGTFSGIGVHVETSAKTGLVTVVSPIKGSPGEKAGLRAGDAIVAVDDQDITRISLDQAVAAIRGPQGTKVKLTVQREGAKEHLSYTIVRATIEISSLDYRIMEGEPGVGYMRIREFNEEVTVRVQKAITDMRKQGMNRMVLDLRQNPGGLLDEAVGISSLFVPPKEPVVFIVHKGGEKETLISRNKSQWELPLVVLVDGGSASASEIVAGAIKDRKIGVLMGLKTFGKGSVQSFRDLPDGGGIKLTTARYLTAGGNSIHEKGIDPDVVLEAQKVLPGDPGDLQLAEAIKYLKSMKR